VSIELIAKTNRLPLLTIFSTASSKFPPIFFPQGLFCQTSSKPASEGISNTTPTIFSTFFLNSSL